MQVQDDSQVHVLCAEPLPAVCGNAMFGNFKAMSAARQTHCAARVKGYVNLLNVHNDLFHAQDLGEPYLAAPAELLDAP